MMAAGSNLIFWCVHMKNNKLISQADEIDRKTKEVSDRVKHELKVKGIDIGGCFPGPVLTALIRNILLVIEDKPE